MLAMQGRIQLSFVWRGILCSRRIQYEMPLSVQAVCSLISIPPSLFNVHPISAENMPAKPQEGQENGEELERVRTVCHI